MNYDRFKFRVWDKEELCYQEEDADFCHINYKGELDCMFTVENGLYCNAVHIQDHCVIEQCTGFRDKTGRLIYEGDVVEYTFSDGKKAQWFIVWNDELCKFAQCNVQWVKNEMLELGNNFSMEHYILFDSAGIRKETLSEKVIVGNIHEPKWGIEK